MINQDMIDKLAHLSMLEFNDQEKEEMKTELEKMIAFIDKLNELDTSGAAPLLHMTDNVDVFRKDETGDQIAPEKTFQNAPLHDGVFFKVPKVIKK